MDAMNLDLKIFAFVKVHAADNYNKNATISVVDVQKVFSILYHSTGDCPYPSRVGRHSKVQPTLKKLKRIWKIKSRPLAIRWQHWIGKGNQYYQRKWEENRCAQLRDYIVCRNRKRQMLDDFGQKYPLQDR